MNCILQRTAQRRQVGKKGYPLYKDKKSFIISDRVKDLGWMMYAVNDCVCSIDIIVLLPEERYKGHGNVIIKDVLAQNPQIRTIILDVQQRNTSAVSFYRKPGFHKVT
ncbi:MAG: GNAT family N-acetyltransferase [Clostridia bacterium]|nr:GNAT family N-acetyltransferase [Clostridia bacterium]